MKFLHKKNILKITVAASISFIFIACTDDSNKFSKFQQDVNFDLNFLQSYEPDSSLKAREIAVFDTLLIILDNKKVDGFLTIYDSRDLNFIAKGGRLGKGENEFLAPAFMKIDKANKLLWFIEYPTTTLYYFKFEDLVKGIVEKKKNDIKFNIELMPFSSYHIFKDTSVMIPTAIDKSLFTVINRNGEIIETGGEVPIDKGYNKKRIKLINGVYASMFVHDESEKLSYFALIHYDKLLKFDHNSKKLEILQGPDKIPFKEKNIVWQNGHVFGKQAYSYSMEIYKDHIFVLYLGDNKIGPDRHIIHPNEIFVFNKNLQPELNLFFSKPVKSFCIDEKNNTLLTNSDDSEKFINKYDLKNLFTN